MLCYVTYLQCRGASQANASVWKMKMGSTVVRISKDNKWVYGTASTTAYMQTHWQQTEGSSNAVIRAARPRSIITLVLFGVRVEEDRMCSLKYIVHELARLGLSVSSYEINGYKCSVMQSQPCEPSKVSAFCAICLSCFSFHWWPQ